MTSWTGDELARVGGADELELIALGTEGEARRPVTIWAVRVGDGLYARSWRGASGNWSRAVQAHPEVHISAGDVERDVELLPAEADIEHAVDEAYRTEYSRYPGYVELMVSADARARTLKLLPRAEAMR